MKKSTIYHPKTKELKGTITELDSPIAFGYKFETEVYGMKDWHVTFDEARTDVLNSLHKEFTGEAGRGRAEDIAYSQSESNACGNY